MTRYKGLKFERHKEIGKRLAEIRDELTNILCEVGNAYPYTKVNAEKYLDTSIKKIDLARVVLEDCMFKEYKDKAEADIYIYYPRRSDRDIPNLPPPPKPFRFKE